MLMLSLSPAPPLDSDVPGTARMRLCSFVEAAFPVVCTIRAPLTVIESTVWLG